MRGNGNVCIALAVRLYQVCIILHANDMCRQRHQTVHVL